MGCILCMTRLYHICLLLVLLFPLAAMSQDTIRAKGYAGSVEFYVGTGHNQIFQNAFGIGFQIVNGYRFNDWFTLGIGIGILTDRLYPIAIPLHLDARFDLSQNRLRPFIQSGIGYGLSSGFNGQLGLGLRFPISNRLGVVTGIAGRLQVGVENVYGPVRVLSRYVEFRLGIAY
jgi:hypothetical protein